MKCASTVKQGENRMNKQAITGIVLSTVSAVALMVGVCYYSYSLGKVRFDNMVLESRIEVLEKHVHGCGKCNTKVMQTDSIVQEDMKHYMKPEDKHKKVSISGGVVHD